MTRESQTTKSGEHEWFRPQGIGMDAVCCRKCGIVKRAHGKNKPCKGVVKVGTRNAA